MEKIYLEFLRENMIAAFGCTEPIALAYASAKASHILDGDPEKIIARCSGNIIKNTKSVIVPGTGGLKGIEISVCLGAIAGDPDKKLEVLHGIDKKKIEQAQEMVNRGVCTVELVEGMIGLYIDIEMWDSKGNRAQVILQNSHTNITKMMKNDEILLEKEAVLEEEKEVDFSFDSIYEVAQTCDYSSIQDVLDRQIEYNLAIAKEGLKSNWGSRIGKTIYSIAKSNKDIAIAHAAAGSDARMSGCELPVVINSGSGNQGITISLPIIIHAEKENLPKEKLYRALIFANLLGEYQKQGIGKLSAYCGVVSAGTAAVAGVAMLNDEPVQVIKDTIVNGLAVTSGMICDGAKPSCAGKIAASINTAYFGYNQAKLGYSYKDGDGVVRKDVDETIRSIGRIARYGMESTDVEILNEMIAVD